MPKVDLSLESKTSNDLSLESKDTSMTWEQSDPGTWADSNSSWGSPKIFSSRESKSASSLSLESK